MKRTHILLALGAAAAIAIGGCSSAGSDDTIPSRSGDTVGGIDGPIGTIDVATMQAAKLDARSVGFEIQTHFLETAALPAVIYSGDAILVDGSRVPLSVDLSAAMFSGSGETDWCFTMTLSDGQTFVSYGAASGLTETANCAYFAWRQVRPLGRLLRGASIVHRMRRRLHGRSPLYEKRGTTRTYSAR